jgi:hypothetical protein
LPHLAFFASCRTVVLGILLGFLLVACGSSTRSSPTGTPSSGTATPQGATGEDAIVARDISILKGESYTVDYHIRSSIGAGGPLWVFHSVCTGSTDGHCQAIDAFRTGDKKPIWHAQPASVLSVKAIPGGFSITSASYASGDPLCCPSGAHVTDSYKWNGARFIEHGVLPRPPTG